MYNSNHHRLSCYNSTCGKVIQSPYRLLRSHLSSQIFYNQNIDNSLKTAIQLMLIQLNTVDGSPMTALGIMTLQLRIADFKFSHNFIICDRLPEMELLFCINVQKKFSLSFAWDREKNCYIQKESRFLTFTRNCEHKANVIVKSALKIPPRHNGIVSIRIKGHAIKGHTAYFIID